MSALTVALPNFGGHFGEGPRKLLDLARMAEDEGVDRIVVADHVAIGSDTSEYPWGAFGLPSETPFLEPLTVLAAMAAVTSTIRLGTAIVIAPLRSAALLAKAAATLDVLSDGRLDLGVGVGWHRPEYDASGVEWEERWQRLSDTMAACKVLWSEGPASFKSETVQFEEIYCSPFPVQPGGVPIWLGGSATPKNLERLATWADGWIPAPPSREGAELTISRLSEGIPKVRRAWRDAGRDPVGLQVRPPLPLVRTGERGPHDLPRSLEALPALFEAGATDVSVPINVFCRDLDCAPSFFKELVHRFREATTG